MARNTGHTSKNKIERDFYTRYIKEQNYEPTIDESLPFDNSNNKEEDFSLQQAVRRRKEPPKDLILRHFEENWIKWLFGAAGAALFYFFVTFQVSLVKVESRSSENEKDISNIDAKIDKTSQQLNDELEKLETKIEAEKDKNQKQELEIQKNSLLIDSKKKK